MGGWGGGKRDSHINQPIFHYYRDTDTTTLTLSHKQENPRATSQLESIPTGMGVSLWTAAAMKRAQLSKADPSHRIQQNPGTGHGSHKSNSH